MRLLCSVDRSELNYGLQLEELGNIGLSFLNSKIKRTHTHNTADTHSHHCRWREKRNSM